MSVGVIITREIKSDENVVINFFSNVCLKDNCFNLVQGHEDYRSDRRRDPDKALSNGRAAPR